MFLIPKSDLDVIVAQLEPEIVSLKDSRILISGASGFIGKWLVSTFDEANKIFDLNLSCLFLSGKSRHDNKLFKSSKFVWKNIDFSLGPDELNFCFTHAFHASTPSNHATGSLDLKKSHAIATNSMKSLLNDATHSRNIPNIVHLSSGAVYSGSHSYKNSAVSEATPLIQSGSDINYVTTKLKLESQINLASTSKIIKGMNARLFAFYGPHLSLDAHFAIGNFMKNALEDSPIKITGNPLTVRSYLHPVDLVVLLIKMLLSPSPIPTNVGSKFPYTILEVANLIGELTNNKNVAFQQNSAQLSSYYPLIDLAEGNYNFTEKISLEEGLERWMRWLTDYPRRIL